MAILPLSVVPDPSRALVEEFAALNLIGESAPFVAALALIKKAASFDVPVLLQGETGTGKEVAAHAVHYLSARAGGPFIPINCGAIPADLTENELFGHERGAFTDARAAQQGAIAMAEGGTLFLDEVDALSPKAQVALLRFLQDREYRPLGSRALRHADLRVIAAANAELKTLVDRGQLRADLFYRLNIVSLRLPPLRERGRDIELLAEYFARGFARRYGQAEKFLEPAAWRALKAYSWPGNVRELENVLHQAFVLAEGDVMRIDTACEATAEATTAACEEAASSACAMRLGEAKANLIAQFERRYLAQLLIDTAGNVSEAARRAGKERRALGKLIKKYGLGRLDVS